MRSALLLFLLPGVDVGDYVVGVSIVLVAFGALALLPHSAPYNQGLLLNLTLLAWSTPVWAAMSTLVALIIGLLAVSVAGHARALRADVVVLALAALLLAIGAMVYVSLLNLNGLQDAPNGRLKMCYNHCANGPHGACVHAPVPVLDDRTPADRAAEAVAFLRSNVIGTPREVSATLAGTQVTVVWGTTGLSQCAYVLDVPSAPSHVLLSVGGAGAYTARIGAQHGWAVLGVSHNPPSACFPGEAAHGRRIANSAALVNVVGSVLYPARALSIIGCSVTSKVAAWAVATALDDVGVVYSNALIDSPGTLGLASVRQVGTCGESYGGLLDRWGIWLATNASEVRDVAAWGSVDVTDTMLATCQSTRYVVSSSQNDAWNNPSGLGLAVDAARAAGCTVEFVNPQGAQHCALFA